MNYLISELIKDPSKTLKGVLGTINGFLDEDIWEVEPLNSGIESLVVLLSGTRSNKKFLLKYVNQRYTNNDNDPDLDYFELYKQECNISKILTDFDVPSVKIHKIIISPENIPALLMDYIYHDGGPPNGYALGQLAKKIHKIHLSGHLTVAMRGKSLSLALMEIMQRRLMVISEHTGQNYSINYLDKLFNLFESLEKDQCLLHMDLRFDNILCRNMTVFAVIDWSNALIGPPLLEIARVFEYDLLTEDFCFGYDDPLTISRLDSLEGLACRLYTAIMMAVLFLREIPDPELANIRLVRLRTILNSISSHI